MRSTTNRITITITHDYNGSHEDMTCMTNTSRSRGTNEHPTNEYPNTGREYWTKRRTVLEKTQHEFDARKGIYAAVVDKTQG